MNTVSRKNFLLSMLPLATLPGLIHSSSKVPSKLSFSTLGCPDWTFDQIIQFAAINGYRGIEVRGILREMDLTKVPEFSSPDAIRISMEKMKRLNLDFVDLGSSAALHLPPGNERTKNLEEAKRFIDLAVALNCPFIRVFPNELPKERDRQETLELIAAGLRELGAYAASKPVTVLLESHGAVVYTKDLWFLMHAVNSAHVALVWDICNMWIVTKEDPETVYAVLHPYIKHTHIKDLKIVDGKEQYVLLGTGIVPIFQAIDLLDKNKYAGYYSFEWEKLWHPEIADPKIALADYPVAMRKHFQGN